MKITVLTLFPSIIDSFFRVSLMQRAIGRSLITYEIINIRDFAEGKYKSCDDQPYGGGAGVVMLADPVIKALRSIQTDEGKVIFPSPSGRVFTQKKAEELAQEKHLIFICGRYEGLDQRAIDLCVDEEFSVGDYILSSGEISSLVIIDVVYRLLDGVITYKSLEEESFSGGLLEYPHYTRPRKFEGLGVPDVLLSGNHAAIAHWRAEKSKEKTKRNRPDLWAAYLEKNKGEIE